MCNSLKRKSHVDQKPAKNVQKPGKAEVNSLPPYPEREAEVNYLPPYPERGRAGEAEVNYLPPYPAGEAEVNYLPPYPEGEAEVNYLPPYPAGEAEVNYLPPYPAGEAEVNYLPPYPEGEAEVNYLPPYPAGEAEVNYLPPYPEGENEETQEQERIQLIKDKMTKTFVQRRHEIINLSPSVEDIKARWPALFETLIRNLSIVEACTVVLNIQFLDTIQLPVVSAERRRSTF
ncbi:hypothetical protein D4764_12G0011230 [Takifugu flavidus]|uniref:Uncharacterized protein n=1 Tax=Takifugu flavidus TaxID=433684 RepID=A0A5C6PE08_9TELE|nr:hypothetical protein D4764_12G0011230 [Takifugu flavidus]